MKRNQTIIKQAFERDKFTCQKCKIEDKTTRILEAHHVIPLCSGGKDELDNLVTLCFDCHHFAPNSKQEFDEYIKEEMDGTSTTLVKAWNKVRSEHPELFKEEKVQEKLSNIQ